MPILQIGKKTTTTASRSAAAETRSIQQERLRRRCIYIYRPLVVSVLLCACVSFLIEMDDSRGASCLAGFEEK